MEATRTVKEPLCSTGPEGQPYDVKVCVELTDGTISHVSFSMHNNGEWWRIYFRDREQVIPRLKRLRDALDEIIQELQRRKKLPHAGVENEPHEA